MAANNSDAYARLKTVAEKHFFLYAVFYREDEYGGCRFASCFTNDKIEGKMRDAGQRAFGESASQSFISHDGDGMLSRVMRTGRYEWVPNVRDLPPGTTSVPCAALAAGGIKVKTVIAAKVHGGVVEVGSLMMLKEDANLTHDMKNHFKPSFGMDAGAGGRGTSGVESHSRAVSSAA